MALNGRALPLTCRKFEFFYFDASRKFEWLSTIEKMTFSAFKALLTGILDLLKLRLFNFRMFTTLSITILVTVVSGQIVQDSIDDHIFDLIEQIFRKKYPRDEKKVLCMTEDIRDNKIVDRFYVKKLLTDLKQLEKDIEPYIENAEANCKLAPKPSIGPSTDAPKPSIGPSTNNGTILQPGEIETATTEPKEDDTSFFKTTGGILVIVSIVAVLLGALGFGAKKIADGKRGQRIPNHDGV